MQNASIEAFLHLDGFPSPIPLDASYYEWRQHVDHRGRPRSQVRAGRWHLATSRLDPAQYEHLLALMLDAHAVVEAHATYGRADGQGTFVTVWGRKCCLCQVYSSFDSRGSTGPAPGWVLYFTLAAEEMGREAGAGGAFVMPAVGEYAYKALAAVAGPVAAARNSDIPPHLPAPAPNPSPNHQQVQVSAAEWQQITSGRWDENNNKKFLKQHRSTEFSIAGNPLTYRVDAKGKVEAVYDSQKSYNITGTRKGLVGIPLTLNGEPTYAGTPHLFPIAGAQKNVVEIEMAGNRSGDFKRANEAAGLINLVRSQGLDADEAPDGYTWHHRDDFKPKSPPNPPYGTCTMELVSVQAHRDTFVHYGSCDQCNKHNNKKLYK